MFKILYKDTKDGVAKKMVVKSEIKYPTRRDLIATLGDTVKGFCVYVGEPHCDYWGKCMICEKSDGNTKEQYYKALGAMRDLASAINEAYMDHQDEFDVSEWLALNT